MKLSTFAIIIVILAMGFGLAFVFIPVKLAAFYGISLSGGGVLMAPRIRHGLPAAGLVHGILDGATQPFQQLQCCNTDFRLECIHVARNEKSHTHGWPSSTN